MKTIQRLICLCFILTMALGAFAGCVPKDPNEGKLVLAKDSEALYTIVIASDANDVIRRAAAQLQTYLEKITGAGFRVVTDDAEETETEFCVGKTNRESDGDFDRVMLGEEGFIIRNTDQKLFLVGGGDRGTLYAVYTFLEEYLGVRYYTETVEKIPVAETLVIEPFEKDNYQKPRMEQRRESLHPSNSAYWNEKQKLNVVTDSQKLPIAGGITYSGPWYVHTFGTLLGWNPSRSYRNQPCLNDIGLYEIMLHNAKRYLAKNPDADVISISQNDSTLAESGECQCSACTAAREQYGSSGVVLNYVNRLATALKSSYPNIRVETLAYYYTQEPPKGGVKAADNVIVRFCNAGGCIRHSLNEESLESDQFYEANTALSYQYLLGWKECAKNLYIWDYGSNFGCTGAIMPSIDRIYDNITLSYDAGANGFFMQGMQDAGEFTELRAYLTAKLLWNPKMTKDEFDAHMTDFLEGYYGVDAAPFIRAYLEDAKEITASIHSSMYADSRRYLPIETKTDESGKVVLNTEIIDRLNAYFDDAEAAAHSFEEVLRIRKSRIPVLYYEVVAHFVTAAETGESEDELAAQSGRYLDAMRASGLNRLKETMAIPDSPNLYNAPLYWGEKYRGVYSDETLAEKREAEEAAKAAEAEGKEESEAEEGADGFIVDTSEEKPKKTEETVIDVTKAEG